VSPIRQLSTLLGLAIALAALWTAGSTAAPSRTQYPVTRIYSIGLNGLGRTALGGAQGELSDQLASLSPDHTRIAFVRDTELWVMNADGSEQHLVLVPNDQDQESFVDGAFQPPAWSPDGRRLAVSTVGASCIHGGTNCATWYSVVVDFLGNRLKSLFAARNVSWSPNGKQLLFEEGEDGGFSLTPEETQIVVSSADGSGGHPVSAKVRHKASECLAAPVWSTDGRRFAFESVDCDTEVSHSVFVGRAGRAVPAQLPGAGAPAWSPDGSRLAFTRGGALFVGDADGSKAKRLVAGGQAVWSRDGKQLAFASHGSRQLSVVQLATGKARQITHERVGTVLVPLGFSADGKRLLYSATR
jgi:Tol biopolymer transport system component